MEKEIIKHLFSSRSVGIFIHVNPDWDCFGSAMALRTVLRGKGVKCDVFTDAPLSFHLNFMETDVIEYSEGSPAPDYDCYCMIDVNSADRIGGWGKFFQSKEDTVCIDHHIMQSCHARLSLVDPSRSAAGELVYELIAASGEKLTKQAAAYLYCAISSDTGSFRYASVTQRTLEIVIELMKTGIDTARLCSMLYERKTLKQLKLQGEAISRLKLYGGGKIGVAGIDRAVMEKYDAKKSDTEFLAQLPRILDGVIISAFFTQLENGDVRVNLRSDGDYNIEPVARLFGGGGHKKAAGCTIKGASFEEAEQMVVTELLKL